MFFIFFILFFLSSCDAFSSDFFNGPSPRSVTNLQELSLEKKFLILDEDASLDFSKILNVPDEKIYVLKDFENDIEFEDAIDDLKKNGFDFTHILFLKEHNFLRTQRILHQYGLSRVREEEYFPFRDKVLMKEFIQKKGFKTPEFALISSYWDIKNFTTKRSSFPIILKSLSGGFKHQIIENDDQLKEIDYDQKFIAESFIDWPLFCIDGLIARGGEVIFLRPHEDDILVLYARDIMKIMPPIHMGGAFHLEVFYDDKNSKNIIFSKISIGSQESYFMRKSLKIQADID
jgi:hypothetical protein